MSTLQHNIHAKEYTPPPSLVPYLTADKFSNLVVGPVGCLAGDTLVITEGGATPIASITRPTRVLSWDESSNQYVLAQASVAIPKGTDYLYRVRTPQGEFDAAGSHLLLCADNVYRRVQDLQAGDVVKACSRDLAQTMLDTCPLAWLSGVPHSTRTDEGCLGGYGVLDRLHGLLALSIQVGALAFAPSHSGAQTYNRPCARAELSPLGALGVELLVRTHLALSDALTGIDGCSPHDAPLQPAVAYRTASCTCAHCEKQHQESQLSQTKIECRQQAQVSDDTVLGSSYGSDLRVSCDSPSLTTTDRTIIGVTRLDRKEIYWDIQVEGTHNYVTVDGAIHHNSTKTTASIMKIAYEAKRVAPCPDGIRRSRCAVIRNTNQMLTDAFLPDFFKWYPDGQAGHFERTNRKFVLRFDDVECEILFRGLDDPNDVRRLLSLQLSFGVMDEFREIHPDIYDALTGRLGRYPDKSMNGVGCCDDTGKQMHKVWGATNPPDADTHWETLLSEPPENTSVTMQPSGMSPEADWVQYLPDDYYANLMQGKSDDWIDVYVHGKFGRSLSGKPVFPGFSRDFHVAKQTLKPLVSLQHPLIIGMDFGLTPACTINQTDLRGRFLTYAELTSENMGITRFLREKLKPLLAQRFPGHPVLIIGDPAGSQRAQTDERSVFDVIKAEGFKVIPAKTNSIVARIGAIEGLLAGQVEGGARHLIDPSCISLIKGLNGGYRYKVKKTGDMEDKPEKNSHSHLCFAAGTRVMTENGEVPIELVMPGEMVPTMVGYHEVTAAWRSSPRAEVSEYRFSDGSVLVATPDHPVFTANRGFVRIDELQYTDVLVSINEGSSWNKNTAYKSSTGLSTTPSQRGIGKHATLSMVEPGICTATCGSSITGKYQTGTTYTTSTAISPTINSKISSAFANMSTLATTWLRELLSSARRPERTSTGYDHLPVLGTGHLKAGSGTASTASVSQRKDQTKSERAPTAVTRSMELRGQPSGAFARQPASLPQGELAESTTSNARAPSAEHCSRVTGTQKQRHAVKLVGVNRCHERKPVYALTVSSDPTFFANGILVHNCDGHQYACLHVDSVFGSLVGGAKSRPVSRVSTGGWT